MCQLTISIVLYNTEKNFIEKCISSLNLSCHTALESKRISQVSLYIVDNSQDSKIYHELTQYIKQLWHCGKLNCSKMDGNIGFGRAHNNVIEQISSNYHLILNPDVDLKIDTIVNAIDYLKKNQEVGLITPYAENEKKEYLYLRKRYPSILVLFLRGLFPYKSKNIFKRKLSYYEMRECDINQEDKEISIASGCFMFFRTNTLIKIQGFCKKFFLYFEDFDLTYRSSMMNKIAYVPSVKIVHHGGYASAKGLKHIYLFCRSSITFFNRFGWKLY